MPLKKNNLNLDKDKYTVLAGDNIFSYILACTIIKEFNISKIYISENNSGSLTKIFQVFKKTSLNYFIYRSFIQLLSKLFFKYSIKHLARLKSIPTKTIKRKKDLEKIDTSKVDLGIAINFDIILPSYFIDSHKIGIINIHASKLPFDKGISPVVWAFCRGDKGIWISFYLMDGGVDTGLVLHSEYIEINKNWSLFRTYCEVLLIASSSITNLITSINKKILESKNNEIKKNNGTYNSWPNTILHSKMRKLKKKYFKFKDLIYIYRLLFSLNNK